MRVIIWTRASGNNFGHGQRRTLLFDILRTLWIILTLVSSVGEFSFKFNSMDRGFTVFCLGFIVFCSGFLWVEIGFIIYFEKLQFLKYGIG